MSGANASDVALRTLSLFAGIGGLDVGFARALRRHGVATRTVCYVEGEAYAASVLAARMADGDVDDAPIWSDVRTFDASAWRGAVDCVIGGFPCTDLSVAGRRAGINGEHSGLFFEFMRIVRDCGARWIAIENVPPILAADNAGTVLAELAALGFDAEWTTVRASDVGAPHRRERVFILAYCNGAGCSIKRRGGLLNGQRPACRNDVDGCGTHVADASGTRLEERRGERTDAQSQCSAVEQASDHIWPPASDDAAGWAAVLEQQPWLAPAIKSDVRRGADGAADWMDVAAAERTHRLRALGNAVVPAAAERAFVELWGRL